MEFKYILKTFNQEGNLAWEYNPLRNLRLEEDSYFYNDLFYTIEELENKFNIYYTINEAGIKDWKGVPKQAIEPVEYKAGQLVDFITDLLNFSLENPLEIIPQYSYDGSVDLIISDGKNTPRIINTRFSPQGLNTYKIIDRLGDADTNIYDGGDKFDSQTNLLKKVLKIPTLTFDGVITSDGLLPIGHYHFYFTYLDADGNETDFVAESSLVAIFIGADKKSIISGWRDENSQKMVKFTLSDIDNEYKYVKVYYTRATSDINSNKVVRAYEIDLKYLNEFGTSEILITGFEHTLEITLDLINPSYQAIEYNKTQAIVLNRLFLSNTKEFETKHRDLLTLSLMFLPYVDSKQICNLNNFSYSDRTKNTYQDPQFIYHYVGYLDEEIYRFGIVYILSNGELSPVYNVRGLKSISDSTTINRYSKLEFNDIWDSDNKCSKEIKYDENTSLLTYETSITNLENVKGVVSLDVSNSDNVHHVHGIGFHVNKEILEVLKNDLHIKGFFFVRLRRIPLVLALAVTMGIDKLSHTPVFPFVAPQDPTSFKSEFTWQSIVNQNNGLLSHDLASPISASYKGAICPEYDINSPYLNQFFTGGEFKIRTSKELPTTYNKNVIIRHDNVDKLRYSDVKIIGVEDSRKLVAIGKEKFSARAGEAEEAWLFEFMNYENKDLKDKAPKNIVRGNFGPFLGITGLPNKRLLIDIMIPGFNEDSMPEYFQIRYNDNSYYSAISERLPIENYLNGDLPLCYRGDSYICLFSHRMNRNFNDSTAKTNDIIVNPKTWRDNVRYKDRVLQYSNPEDKEKDKKGIDLVNVGDLNAVKLGYWVHIPVRSSLNLNIRALDASNAEEVAVFGHPRGFYPYFEMNTEGAYKTPEALCFNMGFGESLSLRYNFNLADAPILLSNFPNRISYSDLNVPGSFKNGFRVFKGDNYRDYPLTYGAITKLLEYSGNLLVIFEHGIGLIPVNERTMSGQSDGGPVYVNTDNVLPMNPNILSDKIGSLWAESIIQTQRGVYGVDTVAKKIWRLQGTEFRCISDLKIQEFLNKNITLFERELTPIVGIRNVKTHYNAFKNDVMFTFYDNLQGFEEKVWNLCWNEDLEKWQTFYSWLPSYSNNIYNLFFSFDRDTSKYIAKLGVSKADSLFADGIVLDNPIISPELFKKGDVLQYVSDSFIIPTKSFNFLLIQLGTYYINSNQFYKSPVLKNKYTKSGIFVFDTVNHVKEYIEGTLIAKLSVTNRYIPTGDGIKNITYNYSIERDKYKNWSNFHIYGDCLFYKREYSDLCSEFYLREYKNGDEAKILTNLEDLNNLSKWKEWVDSDIIQPMYKDDKGVRQELRYNTNKLVTLLNINVNILVERDAEITSSLADRLIQNFKNGITQSAGLYLSTIAIIPKYNMLFLTTDFWKHGLSGIIDIKDEVKPTYWYGKQHPFEFEFVVTEDIDTHKIFDNLEIIANNAEPESFHYEIIGDCYDFADDKKNMYIRQEATKELYQYNGSDIVFDSNYKKMKEEHRPILGSVHFDKSNIFPLFYKRVDTINDIYDSYVAKNNTDTHDYSALSGGEIKYNSTTEEYSIVNHVKAVSMLTGGLLRGNTLYKEDKWYVQINPLHILQNNEESWDKCNLIPGSKNKIPIEFGLNPVDNKILEVDNIYLDKLNGRGITRWKNPKMTSIKMKDKYMKIRIRYKGDKLAIINAIRTFFTPSYS